MKRLLSGFAAAALMAAAAPLSASAEQPEDEILQGTVDGITYYYTGIDSPDMTVTITGAEGAYGELAIPESIDGYMVTAVGDKAFFCNTDITSVTFPDTVTSIGENSFTGCTSLESVNMPDAVEYLGAGCFLSCTSLKLLKLSDSLHEIPVECFLGCNTLAVCDMPKKLSCIGERAFFGCTDLKKVVFENSNVSIYSDALGKYYDLRNDTISKVEDFTFYSSAKEGVLTYCTSNDFPLIELDSIKAGDADMNGTLSAADATAVLREYANASASLAPTFTALQKKNSDLDNDGMITAKDASLLLAAYANSQL